MKNCESCRWRSDEFTSVCTNDASEHVADFVSAEDGCEEWEGKDEESERGTDGSGSTGP